MHCAQVLNFAGIVSEAKVLLVPRNSKTAQRAMPESIFLCYTNFSRRDTVSPVMCGAFTVGDAIFVYANSISFDPLRVVLGLAPVRL